MSSFHFLGLGLFRRLALIVFALGLASDGGSVIYFLERSRQLVEDGVDLICLVARQVGQSSRTDALAPVGWQDIMSHDLQTKRSHV